MNPQREPLPNYPDELPESYKTRQRAPHNTLRGNAPRLTSTNLITYYLPILESLFRRPVVKGPAINTLFLIEK